MDKVYDLIIVGAGPAGITAAVYAVRKNMDFLIISEDLGGQAAWSGDVENYTGYRFLTGPQLVMKFNEHMEAYGIKPQLFENVLGVTKEGDFVVVKTTKNVYRAKSVIIATGKRSNKLNVPGENKFRNLGVTYCATCDGPLYKGRDVAVIGGGNSALDAVMQLMKICQKVYLINIAQELTGDPVMVEKTTTASNVETLNNSSLIKISGADVVESIDISSGSVNRTLSVSGVFVEIGLIPNSDCISIAEKNELGEILIDCYNKTSVEGVFAAGDVTNVPEKQIIIACGEGSKSCLSVFNYISTKKTFKSIT